MLDRVKLKIAVIGSPDAGKTSFINNLVAKVPPESLLAPSPTATYEVTMHEYSSNTRKYEVQLWDCGTNHMSYHKHLRRAFFKNSSAAFIIFNICDAKWKEQMAEWISEAYENECYLVYAIGTKLDLLKEMDPSKIKEDKPSLISSMPNYKEFMESYEYECNQYFEEYQIRHYFQCCHDNICFEVKNIFIGIHDDRHKLTRMSLAQGVRFDGSVLDDEWIKMHQARQKTPKHKNHSVAQINAMRNSLFKSVSPPINSLEQ